MKYAGHCLHKWKRVIHVLFYIAPSKEDHKSPSGSRRGKYACMENGKNRYILTHNISRYVWQYHFILEDEQDCYLHAQYAVKTQENVSEKTEWLWNKFLNLFR